MTATPPPTPTDPVVTMKAILAALDSGADHFTLLRLKPTATPAEVRDQYFRLAKQVHPDLPAFMAKPALRTDATRAFQAITTAHATLSDTTKRAAYLQSLQAKVIEAAVKADEEAQAAAMANASAKGMETPVNQDVARIYLHRGKQRLQVRDWANAQEMLDAASRVLADKDLGDCKIALGWAIFNNTSNPEAERISRAKDLWTEVAQRHPDTALHAQAAYYLAIWHKLHGEMKQVMTYLDTCLRIDPKHVDAQREQRLLERRRTGSMPAVNATDRQKALGGATGRRPSKPANPVASATASQKVPLEKKPSLLERLFGKR